MTGKGSNGKKWAKKPISVPVPIPSLLVLTLKTYMSRDYPYEQNSFETCAQWNE